MKSRLEPHFDIAPTNKSLGSTFQSQHRCFWVLQMSLPQCRGFHSMGNGLATIYHNRMVEVMEIPLNDDGPLIVQPVFVESHLLPFWKAVSPKLGCFDSRFQYMISRWQFYPYLGRSHLQWFAGFADRTWQVQGTTSALTNSSWTSLKSARTPASWRRTLPSACRCGGAIAKVLWNHSDR